MGKSRIVIADIDEKFIIPLELKFLSELNDAADLEIISDPAYFNMYFSQPRNIDVLMIGESLYSDSLRNHNIGKTVVMMEKNAGLFSENGVYTINKYSSINDLYNFIFSLDNKLSTESSERKTKVVLISSASGGTGKTTIALGLSKSLANRYKKVLYINAENMNSFQYWMQGQENIPVTTGIMLGSEGEKVFETVRGFICNEGFDYLPSFATSLMSMNMDISVYENIVESARVRNEYDVIIVDTDAAFDLGKLSMIAKADKVFMIANQTKASAYALEQFTKNVSCNNDEKFIFLCNDYREDGYDAFSGHSNKYSYNVSEYVSHIDNIDEITVHQLGEDKDINKLSFLIL